MCDTHFVIPEFVNYHTYVSGSILGSISHWTFGVYSISHNPVFVGPQVEYFLEYSVVKWSGLGSLLN